MQNETKHDEKQEIGSTEMPTEQTETNSRFMTSSQLRRMNFKRLNFQGAWKDFFGQPAIKFQLSLHGRAGEGKSTFAVKLGDYLALTFGKVLYVSGEEGFCTTLQNKLELMDVDNGNLIFSDLKNLDEILQEVDKNLFRFMILDSLDTLKIDAEKLRELKNIFPNAAIITISQSTKDGKMRGSNEIMHDADITVMVDKGVAITTKNRFKEKGTTYNVFSQKKITNEDRSREVKLDIRSLM